MINYFLTDFVRFQIFCTIRLVDHRTKNLELSYNVKLKTQVVTDSVHAWFLVGFVLLNL